MRKLGSAASCLMLLTLAAVLLHACSLERTRAALRWVARVSRARATADDSEHLIRRVARRLPWRPTCLHEALAADALLANSGVACELRIGARRTGETPAFHAWLEHDGTIIVGASDLQHAVLR